ncbi:MAG: ATP-dependent protease, partial [Acidobacteria bacterium]|nr:ATP-dependent protease [Acidobacteriota bacterium]
EVDIASGMPAFAIVGLPDAAVQDARERVRAALRNSGKLPPSTFRFLPVVKSIVSSNRK